MRGSKKTKHNPCPICGKPRGVGKYEFAHGKCYEQRAMSEGKETVGIYPNGRPIKRESRERAKANAAAKDYRNGRLPEWMYS